MKWFNPTKRYGFIRPDDGGQDLFVQISSVEKAGYTNPAEGASIRRESAEIWSLSRVRSLQLSNHPEEKILVRIAKFIEVRTSPLSLGRPFPFRPRIENALEHDVDGFVLSLA